MQVLMRSTFVADARKDEKELLLANALELKQSKLSFNNLELDSIWSFIDEFVSLHNHVPDVDSLRLHFTETQPNPNIIDQIHILCSLSSITRGDFKKRLAIRVEERREQEAEELFKTGNVINRKGLEIIQEGTRREKQILKGYRDAIQYVTRKGLELNRPTLGLRKEGDVLVDTQHFVEDYNRRKNDPSYATGQLSGIHQLDVTTGGARKGQLWTHAAFTGDLKSTLGFNWVYNQSIYYGHSSCYFSLEMPYDQCQRILYTMHSMHEKFNPARVALGLQKNPDSPISLDYRFVRDGTLTPNEEVLLMDFVLPDLTEGEKNGSYGHMHIRGYDPNEESFRVSDIRMKGEALYRECPFSILVVDHVLLVDSRKVWRSTTEAANEVVRDLKKLAENFNGGEGIALLALFQISREGKKRADKSQGLYNLYDLSYANEIERSSDVLTASYANKEYRKRCRALFQFLKNRDGEMCPPFLVRIEWSSRMLFTCHEPPPNLEAEAEALVKKVEQTRFEDITL